MQEVSKYSTDELRRSSGASGANFEKWFLIWFIAPFVSVFLAIKNFRHASAKNIFWLFCIYFGFVFIFAKDNVGAADSARYATQLTYFHAQSVSWSNLIQTIYNENGGYVDLYQPIATYLVAIFTDNPRWLFTFFAVVFGYFYSRNIWILLSFSQSRINFFTVLVIFYFALLNPIWNINGVRMMTASHIFVFGSLQYFIYGRKIYGVILASISLLVHFSFAFPVLIFFFWLVLPRHLFPYFVFFIITAFVSEINLDVIRNFLSFLPDVFQPRVNSYANADYASQLSSAAKEMRWHVTYSSLASRVFIYFAAVTLFLKLKIWAEREFKFKMLFMFALFLGGWANLASLVPSGARFAVISNSLITVIVAVLLLKNYSLFNGSYRIIASIVLIFIMLFSLRIGMDYMGFLVFFGNPIIALVVENQTPIIEFVKSVL